ncbi:MAG: hypothetical protein HW375_1318 [Anaerolineales bacterium]|nr:hypothetical protein [Anaerolineales bacterium]
MSNKQRGLLIIFIFVISTVLISACTQSLSSAPVATPTLLPADLFVAPLPSAENPMAMIEEFAKQTAAAQTTIANGGTPVSPQAIATIASHAALGTYGVVGMSSRGLADGIAQLLVRDPHRGIEVHTEGDSITIDAYIIVEYGTRVSAVAGSVAKSVRYQVEQMLGMPVAAVSVHVQDLRVSSVD